MKIFGQTLYTSILATIREEAASAVSRSSLARKVCEVLGWKGANGKPKEMNARLLLNTLEKAKGSSFPLPWASAGDERCLVSTGLALKVLRNPDPAFSPQWPEFPHCGQRKPEGQRACSTAQQ